MPQLEKRIADLEAVAEIVVQLAKSFAKGNPAGELPLRGEEWYRGARALLVDQNFSGLAEFEHCYEAYVNVGGATSRVSWDIGSFIHAYNVTGVGSGLPFFLQAFGKARALLKSCVSEVESRQLPIRTELSFTVSVDEFETAQSLLDSSDYEPIVRASGVVARVALERHLLTVAESRTIQIEKNPPNKPKIDASDEFGNARETSQQAQAALSLAPGRDVRVLAGMAMARAGYDHEANKLADWLNEGFPLDTTVQVYVLPSIRAMLAVNHENGKQALKLLEATSGFESACPEAFLYTQPPVYPVYLRGQAYLEDGEGQLAVTEFQKLVAFRYSYILGSLARLQLGRAYVMSGDKDKARAAYLDFLTLWKDADPDIPVLIAAKAEYAKLK